MTERALKAVDTTPALSTLPSPNEWKTIFDMASALVPTGFLPDAIKTPAQAAAIMLKGRELGIPPMYALSNIIVIKGKPSCNAELMLALIKRDHGDQAAKFIKSDDTIATLRYKRREDTEFSTHSFTIQDAQKANLLTNQTWKMYPAAMLRARCISAVARMEFPDSIGGMYTPEELGASARVVDDEVVYDAPAPAAIAEVIDHDTGEITEPTAIQRQSERPSRLSPSKEPITEKTMKWLHVVAEENYEWNHTDLSIFACHLFNVTSMKQLTDVQGQNLVKRIQETPKERAEAKLLEIVNNRADDPAANFLAHAHQDQQADDAEYREVEA